MAKTEMEAPPGRRAEWTDDDVERLIGNWLRIGTLAAAVVAVLGGMLFLAQHGSQRVAYHVFTSEPAELRSVTDILVGALHLESRAVIQLGLLLLIATPVVRVALSLMAFVLQRDRLYILLTSIVLAILTFSLIFGGHP